MFQCSINVERPRVEPRLEPLPALQPEGPQFSGVDMVQLGQEQYATMICSLSPSCCYLGGILGPHCSGAWYLPRYYARRNSRILVTGTSAIYV